MAMADPKVSWDAVYLSNYELTVFWDVHWVSNARDLYECAKKLEPEILRVLENYRAVSRKEATRLEPDHYQGVYFMLLSYAMENLLKAAVISREGRRYKEEFLANKKFPQELREHDLVVLAQMVGLVFEEGEEDLFRRLSRSAVWHGRYPAPLKWPEMSGTATFIDGKERRISWYAADDIERLNALVAGLPARLGFNERDWGCAC
jgi:hypothetical protein